MGRVGTLCVIAVAALAAWVALDGRSAAPVADVGAARPGADAPAFSGEPARLTDVAPVFDAGSPARPGERHVAGVVEVAPAPAPAPAKGAAGEKRVRIEVKPGIEVVGQVVDALGNGVDGAEVLLSERWNPGRVERATVADAAGRFRLTDVGQDTTVSARAKGRRASRQVVPRGAPGARMEVVLYLEAAGTSIFGVVLGPRGEPVAGALVVIGAEPDEQPGGRDTRDGFDTVPPAPVRLVADDSGKFATTAGPEGPSVLRVSAEGCAPHSEPRTFLPRAANEVTVRLQPAARVIGTVVAADGAPVGGALVSTGRGFGHASARTDAAGAFELSDLAPGPAHLEASHSRAGLARIELELVAGEVATWHAALEPTLAIHGRVLDAEGRGAPRYTVSAVAHKGGPTRGTNTGPDGSFRVPHVEPTAYRVTVRRGGDEWRQFPLLTVTDVVPSDEPLILRLDAASLDAGELVGVVLGPDGAPVSGARVTVWHAAKRLWSTIDVDADTGRFAAGDVPAGALQLAMEAPGFGSRELGVRELAAGDVLDLGEQRFAAVGRLEGTVRGISPERAAELELFALPLGGDARWARVKVVASELTSDPLAAGRWRLTARGRRVAYREIEFEVRAGERTRVDLDLVTCGELRVRITSETALPYAPWCALRDAAGLVAWRANQPRRDGDAFIADVFAPAGSYTFQCGAGAERTASLPVTLTGAEDDGEVRVTLP